ncbi:MAG: hypothetical protein L6264_03610 [Weeksellaceae bacterium]|nr:hypothetical protein [Bacteroidota bacterium]MCG2780010.1 hypothetical protein [Weeksellaceae bacterium]
MKKILLLSALIGFQSIFSQVTMSGNKLEKDGQTYKMSKYSEVLSNPDAQKAFQKARTNNTVGQIFAYAGGFAIGAGIIPALSGKKQEVRNGMVYENQPSRGWAVVGVGAALVGIGIPFAIAANKNAKQALEIENGASTAFQPYFKLQTAGNGMALSYNF